MQNQPQLNYRTTRSTLMFSVILITLIYAGYQSAEILWDHIVSSTAQEINNWASQPIAIQ